MFYAQHFDETIHQIDISLFSKDKQFLKKVTPRNTIVITSNIIYMTAEVIPKFSRYHQETDILAQF